jgi:hypothetical protein
MKFVTPIVVALLCVLAASARADWEEQSLITATGKHVFSMVLPGDLVMNDKFAGVLLHLQ